uniref:UvrD-like helicase ATP-binding domain-containing protein n=1 Tax=Mycena chlorophos TaxID=658473 RepID=A0ABQ0MDU1_MYCCL|nr:predicted protein [Mycena chlorophos]
MAAPRKLPYRADLFAFSTTSTVEQVEDVMLEFGSIVNAANVDRILRDVIDLESGAAARLAIAAIEPQLLLDAFPHKPQDFKASLAALILAQLSILFVHLDKIHSLHEHHFNIVTDASEILAFVAERLEAESAAATQTKRGKPTPLFEVRLRPRRNSRRATTTDDASSKAADSFQRLGIDPPNSIRELERAQELILVTQKSILEAYLKALQLPAVLEALRIGCIPTMEAMPQPEAAEDGAELNDAEAGAAVDIQLDHAEALPVFGTVKFSTIYRKRVKGFGDWDINVAPQAEQDLRALRKRDPGLFSRLVKTTLRALSNGDFAPSNQERVNVGEFPIFKAHFEDFTVVYHVDCVPLNDTNHQQGPSATLGSPPHSAHLPVAIKIFGLYTDGQVTATFWESMGRELAKRGSSYVERCARRQHNTSKEDRFVPAVFPAATPAGEKTEPQLPTDDTEQILSLLLKTVHFSQHVLDSILKDIDATFVLEISPEECKIVEHDFSCYVFGRSGTGKTTTMLYKMLLIEASSLDSATRPVRQLFVTQSRTLADKVGEDFTHLLGGYRPAAVARNLVASKLADTALLARTERDKLRSDLPKQYSELQDRDFPLFVSFEQLCSMLEQDVAARLGDENVFKRDYLNFDKFKSEYWPHFAQSLTKGFDAMTVYSQIMGVIKGSEAALRSKRSYLDREGYMAANSQRAVASDQKSRTYDLFERYLAEKKRRGDLDVADRTRLVLSHFREHGVAGQKIDYLYVDEVQDNLLIDLLLLRSICHNPNGLFWAGDTAQTINAGSAFRFKELKAFMYTVEQGRKSKHPEHAFLPAAPPKVFQLTTNYRSHTGIVNCARTLVDTITKLWPDSIDKLEPERGTVEGLIPIFFNSWEAETTEANQFLFGAETSGGRIDFGAHQCILVRDKAVRDRLLRDVGEVAIILPVYDAKGLEFNDILLYNFFADSHVDEAQWRVVLNMLEGVRAPPLDALRHGAVCTELKFLYVAVTRARNNLWIADCSTKGEAMRELWSSRAQIQNCTLGEDIPRFAISSTPEEWRARAEELFDKHLYSTAKMCFERARMPLQAHVCEAYELMQDALDMAHKSQQRASLVSAGNAFLECARQTEGSSVSEDYAALAGKCFEDAGERRRAIDAYMLAGDFGKVANLYRLDGNFDDALRIIREHPEIDSKTIAMITRTARVSFIHKRQFKKAVEFKLFDDSQDAVGYLSELGLHEERAQVLEEVAEQPSAAAEVHLQEGRLLKAIELFVADKNFERATACVIQGLWEALPFAATALPTKDNVSQLLKFAAQLEALSIKPIEFSMFRAIVNEDVDVLRVLGRTFHESNNAPSSLLCLDHYFTRRFDVRHLDADPLVQHLELFLIFVKRLYAACFEVDPAAVAGAGRLFGYAKEGETRFSIRATSPLHAFLRDSTPTTNAPVVASAFRLRWAYQAFIRDRLVAHVRRENLSCGGNKIFEGPCLTYALFNGRCNRGDCQQEHLDPATLTPEGYTLRVRAHVIQILIFQMQQFERSSMAERSHWLSRLYNILNPVTHSLGTPARLRRIPEVADGLRVIADWLRDRAYALDFDPRSQIRFLTRLMETTQLSFHFYRHRAMDYLAQAPFMVDPRKPLVYRRPPDGQYVVAELLLSLQDMDQSSVAAGVLFLRHIVNKSLPLQIRQLCDLADDICARLVIGRQQWWGLVHDITLPLSWFIRRLVAGGASFVSARASSHVICGIFAEALIALLQPIASGIDAGNLLFESKDLGSEKIGFAIRNIFLARVFRCLGLLAYNVRSEPLRDLVYRSIVAVGRDSNRTFPSMTARFVYARDWPEMARAVRESTRGSMLDEMVQLLHASQAPPRETPNVRQIVYQDIAADLPHALGQAPAPLTAFDPSGYTPSSAEPVPEHSPDDEHTHEDGPIEVATLESAARPQQQLDAAELLLKALQRAYKRGKERDQERGKPGGSSSSAVIELFLDLSRVVKIGNDSTLADRMYARHVWGPLQHLLHCLNAVHHAAQSIAQDIKRDFEKTDSEAFDELEKCEDKLRAITHLLKSVGSLQKALGSTDAEGLHHRRDLPALKQRVRDATAILNTLSFHRPVSVESHLRVVKKWMANWVDGDVGLRWPLQSLLRCLGRVLRVAEQEVTRLEEEIESISKDQAILEDCDQNDNALRTLEEKLDAVQQTYKNVDTLRDLLGTAKGPRNLVALRQQMREAVDLFDALPFARPSGMDAQLDLVKYWMSNWSEDTTEDGVEVVVEVVNKNAAVRKVDGAKMAKKNERRPRLNTNDLYEY